MYISYKEFFSALIFKMNITLSKTEKEQKEVYWPFYFGSKVGLNRICVSFHIFIKFQSEREMLDKVHAGTFLVLFLLGIASHVYSFIRLLEKNKQKRTNKSAIIYKNLFAMDIFIISCCFPSKLVWLLFSKSNIVCKITRFSGFMGFYGVVSFLIIMSLDR